MYLHANWIVYEWNVKLNNIDLIFVLKWYMINSQFHINTLMLCSFMHIIIMFKYMIRTYVFLFHPNTKSSWHNTHMEMLLWRHFLHGLHRKLSFQCSQWRDFRHLRTSTSAMTLCNNKPTQRWLLVIWTIQNKIQWNSNQNANIFVQENEFENVKKMSKILLIAENKKK